MDQACHLWEWCLHKGITVSAEYLPGQENWIADKESQWIQTAVEWKLHGKVFSLIQKVLGPCQIDLFASQLNNQLRDYVSWKPDPFAVAMDASQLSWNHRLGYVFPPFALIGKMCSESTKGTEYHSVGDSPLEGTDLVPGTLGSGSGVSTSPPQETKPPEGSPRQIAPTGRPREPPASCLESVRGHFSAAGVSQQAAELLVAGWSRGTNSAYESAWKRWLGWCDSRQVDPISCGVYPFLDFIGSLFAEGLQYRSINGIRSAVSMTHDPIEGTPIGQHPLVKHLLKGVYN